MIFFDETWGVVGFGLGCAIFSGTFSRSTNYNVRQFIIKARLDCEKK